MGHSTWVPTDLDQLQTHVASDEQFDFLFFWRHQVPKDGTITKSCFSSVVPVCGVGREHLYPQKKRYFAASVAIPECTNRIAVSHV